MSETGFDRGAAITRSLLGWGVVAGPLYIAAGLILAFITDGFDLTRHALSLLALGDHGWIQQTSAVLSGIMVAAASAGLLRTIGQGRGRVVGWLVAVYGLCLILSAAFTPDPVTDFPDMADAVTTSVSGALHLAVGGVGLMALGAAAFAYATWGPGTGSGKRSTISMALGGMIVGGFLAGAALATSSLGVALLWLAVLAGWTWLALVSADAYRRSPHPDRAEPDTA